MTTRPLVVVVLLALGLEPTIADAVEEADLDALVGHPIAQITVRGNRRIEDAVVLAAVGSRPGGALDRDQVRADLHALWRLGWFADVAASVELDAASDALTLVYQVVERPRIGRLAVHGAHVLGADEVRAASGLTVDAPLGAGALTAAVHAIEARYRDAGHLLAAVAIGARRRGDALDLTIDVREGAKVVVERVRFVGNHALAAGELAAVMSTQPGSALPWLGGDGAYREATLARDLALVTARYADAGYLEAEVGPPRLGLAHDHRALTIAIPIAEGPVYRIGRVTIAGDLAVAAGGPAGLLRLRRGERFRTGQVVAELARIADAYRERGRADCEVARDVHLDRQRHRADLALHIHAGPVVTVERIEIRGNTRTRDRVIRRELALAEGEVLRPSAVEASRARIAALGLFDRVEIRREPGARADLTRLTVEVDERHAGTISAGGGYSTRDAWFVQGQVGQANLFGRGQSLAASAQLSTGRTAFDLRFTEPHLLDSELSLAVDGFATARRFGGVTSSLGPLAREARGGRIGLGRWLTSTTQVALSYTLEDVAIGAPAGGLLGFGARAARVPLELADLYRGGRTSALRLSLSRDTRDDRLRPRDGALLTAYAEVAAGALGSDNRYGRVGGEARLYRPLGPFTLALHGRLGYVASRDPRGVPLTERFLLGGDDDVRGFRPGSIGPRLELPDPRRPDDPLATASLGGNLEVVTGAELELPLVARLGLSGVVFADAGNAFNLESRYCGAAGPAHAAAIDPCGPGGLPHLRTAVGFGLRWRSPIGPIRLDWGIPLDRLPGEDRVVFELGFGGSY